MGTTFSVKSIVEKAFENCADITSVVIPNSVTTIGAAAFRGCTGLASLTIPKSVTSIGLSAFYNSNVLVQVVADIELVFLAIVLKIHLSGFQLLGHVYRFVDVQVEGGAGFGEVLIVGVKIIGLTVNQIITLIVEREVWFAVDVV